MAKKHKVDNGEQLTAFDDHPDYDRENLAKHAAVAALVQDVFGVAGAELHLTLVGGDERHGNLRDVVMGHDGLSPVAVRIWREGDGEPVLIPWHAISVYALR